MPDWLSSFLGPMRFRRAVASAACALVAEHGPLAYAVAREQARQVPPGIGRDRFWSRVALRIATQEGRTIGVHGADRYPGP